jgi:spore maturation protein CgeB
MGRVCLSQKPTNLPGRMNLHTTLKNVLWYDKDTDITSKLKTHLQNEKGLKVIGDNARQEVLAKHTHTHRVKSMLANI